MKNKAIRASLSAAIFVYWVIIASVWADPCADALGEANTLDPNGDKITDFMTKNGKHTALHEVYKLSERTSDPNNTDQQQTSFAAAARSAATAIANVPSASVCSQQSAMNSGDSYKKSTVLAQAKRVEDHVKFEKKYLFTSAPANPFGLAFYRLISDVEAVADGAINFAINNQGRTTSTQGPAKEVSNSNQQ